MATIRDWIDYFKELDDSTRQELHRALETLSANSMFQEHYGGDLINLKYAVEAANRENSKEV